MIHIIALGVAVGAGVVAYIGAKKRSGQLRQLAQELGLDYRPKIDREIGRRFPNLRALHTGHFRYATQVISGAYQGHQILAFDYMWSEETVGRGGDGQRWGTFSS